MIIGYDFWNDNIYLPSDEGQTFEKQILDNDGVAFDICNPTLSFDNVKIQNATYDELEILRDTSLSEINTEKSEGWLQDTILLAKFQNNLIGGTAGIDGYKISALQFMKRKTNETEWKMYKEVPCIEGQMNYEYIDRFIESEQEYEYGIRPVAYVYNESNELIDTKYGEISAKDIIYIKFEHAYLVGRDNDNNEISYTLIYNFILGDITNNIDANVITTLSGQYPTVIYGQSDYRSGQIECLLVTEESATGTINVATEKTLRENIKKFLSNKKPKILKFADGTYMLINLNNNYTLTSNENLLGSYTLSFGYVEIGDANDVNTLSKCGLLG